MNMTFSTRVASPRCGTGTPRRGVQWTDNEHTTAARRPARNQPTLLRPALTSGPTRLTQVNSHTVRARRGTLSPPRRDGGCGLPARHGAAGTAVAGRQGWQTQPRSAAVLPSTPTTPAHQPPAAMPPGPQHRRRLRSAQWQCAAPPTPCGRRANPRPAVRRTCATCARPCRSERKCSGGPGGGEDVTLHRDPLPPPLPPSKS